MSTLRVDKITPYLSSSVLIEGNVIQANAATTGSNTFVGDQNIQGTITASIAEGFALVGGVGNVSTLVATSSFGGALPSGVVSGSTQIIELGFTTTGSNSFNGNQTITGSVTISGSAANDLTIEGRQLITGPTTGQTPQLFVSSSTYNNLIEPNRFRIQKPSFSYELFNAGVSPLSSSFLYNFSDNLSATASYTVGVFDENFTQDVELVLETTTTNGILFKDIRSDTGAYQTFLRIAPNGGTNPPLEFKRGMQVTGSVNVSDVIQLAQKNPLPSGADGQLAVSGSNLYFFSGSAWNRVAFA